MQVSAVKAAEAGGAQALLPQSLKDGPSRVRERITQPPTTAQSSCPQL